MICELVLVSLTFIHHEVMLLLLLLKQSGRRSGSSNDKFRHTLILFPSDYSSLWVWEAIVQASHKKKGKEEKGKDKKGKKTRGSSCANFVCLFRPFFVVVKCFLDVRRPQQSSSSAC